MEWDKNGSQLLGQVGVNEIQDTLSVHTENAACAGAVPIESEGCHARNDFRLSRAGAVEIRSTGVAEASSTGVGVVRQ